MATLKNRVNPINIAPFVDVLLILFVILVVVARFDGVKKSKEYIQENQILSKKILKAQKKIKSLQGKISKQIKENESLNNLIENLKTSEKKRLYTIKQIRTSSKKQ
jgi:biopolymer transport protein ExbD